jgi:hypothetical protein
MSNEQYFYKILQEYGRYLERCEEDGTEAMDLISYACLGYDIGEDDALCSEFIIWTKNHK